MFACFMSFICVFTFACIFVYTNKQNPFLFMSTICSGGGSGGGGVVWICLKLKDNDFGSRGS